MFGHQEDNNGDEHHDGNLASQPVQGDVSGTDNEHGNPALPSEMSSFGAPSDDTPTHDDTHDDTVTPAVSGGQPASAHEDDDMLTPSPANDLLDIKTQALQQLTPLVDHLDQSPEEKFRTTMMMIQASDDQALIKAAYEAAKDIADEKAKAQALLDIVNEINYFTHQDKSEA